MSNMKIEQMLYEAKETLPTTDATWEAPKNNKKSMKLWQKIAACFVTVILLVAGTNTVFANIDEIKKIPKIVEEVLSGWNLWASNNPDREQWFEGFEVTSHQIGDKMYPAIYNEDVYVVFLEKEAQILKDEMTDSYNSYTIAMSEHVYDRLEAIRGDAIMYDVNRDGVGEMIISTFEGGTNLSICDVDIIDFKNRTTIPLDYNVEMLASKMPEIEIVEEVLAKDGSRQSIEVRYEMGGETYTHEIDLTYVMSEDLTFCLDVLERDERTFCEDGTIRVDTCIGFSNGIYLEDVVGELVGTLTYEPDKGCYVFDENSVWIEWGEETK